MTRLRPFEIHRAASVEEATALVEQHGDEAALYAGGTELLLLMKLGFASFGHLVDVKPIASLGTLERIGDGGHLRIGGTVTHRTIERSPVVAEGWPALAEMERHVANVRVRATGTLGGNLAFADPHSDPATFLLAAAATIHLARAGRRRAMPVGDFVLGPYQTALEPGELVDSVEVPAMGPGEAMAHLRFAVHERPTATVSAWIRVEEGRVSAARLAAGSVGVVPVAPAEAGERIVGQRADALDPAAVRDMGVVLADASAPVSDGNGGADYKHALVVELAGRAAREAAMRALARPMARRGTHG